MARRSRLARYPASAMAPAPPITLCGSLSRYPVRLGADMHLAGYRALGLDFTYVPFACEDLAGALAGMRALGIRGFGVSMPFKLQIIPLLDGLDPLSGRIGAVNTVVNDHGVLTGHNTDAWGAARALEEVMPLAGKRVTVIGAGGAARAVAFSLASEGMRVHLVNRTPERAAALARDIAPVATHSVTSGGLDDLTKRGSDALADTDAIVNASSAGMSDVDAQSPVPESALRPGLVVMDIVYKPIETELVRAARAAGATAVHGGRMLLHQAARQFSLYTGREAPLEAMDAALQRGLGPAGA